MVRGVSDRDPSIQGTGISQETTKLKTPIQSKTDSVAPPVIKKSGISFLEGLKLFFTFQWGKLFFGTSSKQSPSSDVAGDILKTKKESPSLTGGLTSEQFKDLDETDRTLPSASVSERSSLPPMKPLKEFIEIPSEDEQQPLRKNVQAPRQNTTLEDARALLDSIYLKPNSWVSFEREVNPQGEERLLCIVKDPNARKGKEEAAYDLGAYLKIAGLPNGRDYKFPREVGTYQKMTEWFYQNKIPM